ncbi:hypothetical protein [Spirillospora sp. NPDC047279]|uniref:hypothetical protein n=1 Tax=Spirillospora sp. NPDC047279 TaxID=3155478 RepID=UPI0033E3AA36
MAGGYAITLGVAEMQAQVIARNYGLQLADAADRRANELGRQFATDRDAARVFLEEYNNRNRNTWTKWTWPFGGNTYKSSELRHDLAELVKRLYPELVATGEPLDDVSLTPQNPLDRTGVLTPADIARIRDTPALYQYRTGMEGKGLDRLLLLRDRKPPASAPRVELAPPQEPHDAGPPKSGVRMYGQEMRHGVGSGGRMPHEGWRDDDEPSYGNQNRGHNTIDPDRGGTPPRRDGNTLNEGGGRGVGPSGPPAGGAPSGAAPAPTGPPAGGEQPSPGNAGGPPATGGTGPAPEPGPGRLKRLERGPEGRSAPASPSVRV